MRSLWSIPRSAMPCGMRSRRSASSFRAWKNPPSAPPGSTAGRRSFVWCKARRYGRTTGHGSSTPSRASAAPSASASRGPPTSAASKLQPGKSGTAVREHIDALLGETDVLCLPTSPRNAPLRGTEHHELEVVYRYQAMSLLGIAGLGGLPQISLPLATLEGCPLGLSLVGRRGADEQLLKLSVLIMERWG